MDAQRIGTMKPGTPFRTRLTGRPGLILESRGRGRTRQGVVVQLLDPAEEKGLDPAVLVDPRDDKEAEL